LTARIATAAFLAGGLALTAAAAELRTQAVAALDRYVEQAEERIQHEQSSTESFLAINSLPPADRSEVEERLRRGEVRVEKHGASPRQVPGGLVHHWQGVAFIPGATTGQVLHVVQDYDHLARYYHPEVVSSQLISHDGQDFRIAMRLRKHKVVTVVLDTEYDVHYGRLDTAHQFSLSRSTRVAEIADPGKRDEKALDNTHDHGFMWRLNTYWRFVQFADGVLVQCEAISLTRDIPTGLGWLVGPIINDIPRESLQFTLKATRAAVLGQTSEQRMQTDAAQLGKR
jgi:hypothetical protein